MDFPLYLNIEQAALFTGIGQKTLRDMLNSRCPPPFIRIGSKRLIQRDALPGYLEEKQEVKR